MNRVASRLLLATSTVGAGAAVLEGSGGFAVAGGLLLAFALPGLALVDLMVRDRTLTPAERLTLGPALSLALVVIGGLVLFATGVDLSRQSWVGLTVGTAMVALAAATTRDRVLAARAVAAEAPPAAAAPFAVSVSNASAGSAGSAGGRTGLVRTGTSIAQADRPEDVPAGAVVPTGRWLVRALPLVLAAAVLGGVAWMSVQSAREAVPASVTALSATAAGPVTANEMRPVAVEVTGLDLAYGPHRIVVTGTNGKPLQVRQVPAQDTTWQGTLLLSGRERLSIQLLRTGDAVPYRTVLISSAI